jgi:hypothetical protein
MDGVLAGGCATAIRCQCGVLEGRRGGAPVEGGGWVLAAGGVGQGGGWLVRGHWVAAGEPARG